ncbi:hypothetical protein Tco_0961584 [Tanacetum coccineum]
MSEFKQTNQFVEAISSILGIADNYLASKMKDAVDVDVQLQTNKHMEEAQAENHEFLNQIEKYVTESLGAEVLVRSTNQPQTSYAVAALLSEFKLKKIHIDKIETNKSINRSDVQNDLYKVLVESCNSDKDIISSYGDIVTLKKSRDDQDKDENPSVGSNRGLKRRRSGKEAKSSKEPTYKESKSTSSSKGASRSQLKSSGNSAQAEEHGQNVDDLEEHTHQEFNTRDDDVIPVQETLEDASQWNPPSSPTPDRIQSLFNEFLDTPIDFSAFIMHRLKIENLTQEVLIGPTYNLIKDTCKSVVELEYHLGEVFKATNDRLDWHNPEGKPYPHDLSKPLPLIQNEQGRQVIPWDYFINNDLEYLKGGSSSQKYTTSITKMKAADYGQIKWIEDNHLEEIIVRRQDDQLYKFREGDFKILRRQHIEDMLLLLVQGKLTNLNLEERYQKKINLTKPNIYRSHLQRMTPYTAYPDIQGVIYKDEMNKNHLIRTDELYKISDGTLNHVRTALNDIAIGLEMDYFPKRKWSKQDKQRARVMINAIDRKLRDRRLMRNLEKFVGGRPYRGDLRLLERTI